MIYMKFATDTEKSVITSNCEARGWIFTSPDDDWNLFWASVQSVRTIFNSECGYRLGDNQVKSLLQWLDFRLSVDGEPFSEPL